MKEKTWNRNPMGIAKYWFTPWRELIINGELFTGDTDDDRNPAERCITTGEFRHLLGWRTYRCLPRVSWKFWLFSSLVLLKGLWRDYQLKSMAFFWLLPVRTGLGIIWLRFKDTGWYLLTTLTTAAEHTILLLRIRDHGRPTSLGNADLTVPQDALRFRWVKMTDVVGYWG